MSTTFLLHRSLRNGTLSFRSSEGYEVRDILDLKVDGVSHSVFTSHQHTVFVSCDKCIVTRNPYVRNANVPPCSLWVTEHSLDGDYKCCEFVFDLLCGTTPRYQIYDNGCKAPA